MVVQNRDNQVWLHLEPILVELSAMSFYDGRPIYVRAGPCPWQAVIRCRRYTQKSVAFRKRLAKEPPKANHG